MKAEPLPDDQMDWTFLKDGSSARMLFFFIRKRWLPYTALFIILGLGIFLDLSLAWF